MFESSYDISMDALFKKTWVPKPHQRPSHNGRYPEIPLSPPQSHPTQQHPTLPPNQLSIRNNRPHWIPTPATGTTTPGTTQTLVLSQQPKPKLFNLATTTTTRTNSLETVARSHNLDVRQYGRNIPATATGPMASTTATTNGIGLSTLQHKISTTGLEHSGMSTGPSDAPPIISTTQHNPLPKLTYPLIANQPRLLITHGLIVRKLLPLWAFRSLSSSISIRGGSLYDRLHKTECQKEESLIRSRVTLA